MSRVYKSSVVSVGIIKELKSTTPLIEEVIEETQVEVDYDKLYKREYEQKILELEAELEKKRLDNDSYIDSLKAQAEIDAQRMKEEAYNQGFKGGKDSGFKEGYEEGRSLFNESIKAVEKIKEDLINTKHELYEKVEENAIKLIVDITQKILNRAITEKEYILNLIKAAIEKCAYTEDVTIRVSVEDYEATKNLESKIVCLIPNVEEIRIKKDASLKKGSCILDTSSGSIDSSIENQFNEIKAIFEKMLESEVSH